MIAARWARRGVVAALRRAGYDLVRPVPPDPRYEEASFDARRPLPPGAADVLQRDHPRLTGLVERYERLRDPIAARTYWRRGYLTTELELQRFRGDNAYVWQFRNVAAMARYKYYFYMRDLASGDTRCLFDVLHEDGLFGCWTFDYPGWPTVSRDLLDSINELHFLDRHLGLLSRPGLTVLDIGAGYGRLAHRALAAAPLLGSYLCVDGVAESTFLCEYYLEFRGCLDRAEVIPVDEFDQRVPGRRIDVAVNIHSFSEMSVSTIDAWLARLKALAVPWLFLVPNDADRLLSVEDDDRRDDFAPLLEKHGFELVVKEPVFPDDTMREFMNVSDHFLLYRTRPAKSP